jgi:hypothetical protein
VNALNKEFERIKSYECTEAEQTTLARMEAYRCFRNIFTFIVANSIMASRTHHINMDATQFKVGGSLDEMKVRRITKANGRKHTKAGLPSAPVVFRMKQTLALYIALLNLWCDMDLFYSD